MMFITLLQVIVTKGFADAPRAGGAGSFIHMTTATNPRSA